MKTNVDKRIQQILDDLEIIGIEIQQNEFLRDHDDTLSQEEIDEYQRKADLAYEKLAEKIKEGNAIGIGYFDDIGNYYANDLQMIGRMISRAIKKSSWKKYEITEITGLSRDQIIAIEKGSKNYTIESLIKLCNLLKLRIRIDSYITDELYKS